MDHETRKELAVRLFQQAYQHQRNKELDEAIPWLERALKAPRYESYCYPHMNLGRVYESKEQWFRAEEEYRKAIAEDQHYTPAAEALSRVARIRGNLN